MEVEWLSNSKNNSSKWDNFFGIFEVFFHLLNCVFSVLACPLGITNAILLSFRIIYGFCGSDLVTEYKIAFGRVVMMWVLLYCVPRNESKKFSSSMTSWEFAHPWTFSGIHLQRRVLQNEEKWHGTNQKLTIFFCYHIYWWTALCKCQS